MPRIARNDPRFDASSMVVKFDGDEIEFVSISYADKVTPGIASAGGTQIDVGSTPGKYKADDARLVMHKDFHAGWFMQLGATAKNQGFSGISRPRHVVTVSYAEPDMPQLTDTLYGVRVLSGGNSDKEGSDPLTVEVSLFVWRIKYHGDVSLA